MKVSYSDGNLLLKNQDACARFYELQLRDAQYHYCPPRTGPEKVCDFENLGLLLEPDGRQLGCKSAGKGTFGGPWLESRGCGSNKSRQLGETELVLDFLQLPGSPRSFTRLNVTAAEPVILVQSWQRRSHSCPQRRLADPASNFQSNGLRCYIPPPHESTLHGAPRPGHLELITTVRVSLFARKGLPLDLKSIQT